MEKPMSMVDRVARAMADRSKARVAGMYSITALPMDGEEDFLALAQAAIEEMRDPTPVMKSATYMRDYEALEIWEGMIDAALKEPNNV
jgi:hypothetical protein